MADRPSLAGPLARIDRADELVVDLQAALKVFLASRPYNVEERPDSDPAVRAFVITSLMDIPARPRIIAGESRIIFARRSTCWPISYCSRLVSRTRSGFVPAGFR